MGIHVAWDDDEKTVLCHTYIGAWTVEDLYEAVDENRRLCLEVGYLVDLIMTCAPVATPIRYLACLSICERRAPPNQRLVVMVQTGAVMQAFNRVIQTIAPTISEQRYLVNSMDEARELIARYRADLEAKH